MKKELPLIIINAVLLIAIIVCLAVSASIRNTLLSQQAAAAWAGQSGERFAQLSVFFPGGSNFNEMSIFELRDSIDKALIDASVEHPEGQTLYTDAWSAPGEVGIVAGRRSATAPVLGVGGNFFMFHPLRIRDGSYISGNDLTKDRVVLDEELAWRLFGAVNIADFEILVNGKPYIIAGVVSRENDFASLKAYSGGAGLFMSFEALHEMSEATEIFCYELVMPNPISGFALKTLEDNLTAADAIIVENSTRFSLTNIWGQIITFGERSMRENEIVFPYWENAARYAEDRLMLLFVLTILLSLCPAVCGVIYGAKGTRYLIAQLKRMIIEKLEKRDLRKTEEYRQKHHT